MKLNIKNREQGFTIIEVLIVLAIAGLIMLIVFLAVPALQRNSRNTQRTSDASRIAAAVNECLNNKNGKIGSCDAFTVAELGTYIDLGDNQQLETASSAGLNSFAFSLSARCNAEGSSSSAGGGTRSFAIVYQVETRGTPAGRCVGS